MDGIKISTEEIKRKRYEFSKFKKTESFRLWLFLQNYIQRQRCYYCDELYPCYSQHPDDYEHFKLVATIDHIIPLAYAGTNDVENLVISCSSCNSRKGTKTNKRGRLHLKFSINERLDNILRLDGFREGYKI